MARINSRVKGRSGEQEIVKLLTTKLGDFLVDRHGHPLEISRNLDQVREGGADIMSIPPFAIEIKRHENLLVNAWWSQTLSQCTRTNPIPVLMYRKNRQPWTVRMLARDICRKKLAGLPDNVVELGIDHFFFIISQLYDPKKQ